MDNNQHYAKYKETLQYRQCFQMGVTAYESGLEMEPPWRVPKDSDPWDFRRRAWCDGWLHGRSGE